jgi:diadenosine tetraphosphatase ApaH/serine/threonine PP2A family protein phosphatase
VLADLDRVGVDALLCLGDIVGYGADPGPVLDTVGARVAATVAGNHDQAAIGRLDLAWFNPYARRAAEWTADRLGPAQAAYLALLPLVIEHGEATLAHASPQDPAQWSYLVTAADGARAFPHFRTRLCFVGHSHLPAVWALDGKGRVAYRRGDGPLALAAGERYVINVGSVGQPRDGHPLAAYAVWDLAGDAVEIRRVPYDVGEARRRIHAAGLPRLLGDRLLDGR